MECDTCLAKPGMPILCNGCLHNRGIIERFSDLQQKIERMIGITFEKKGQVEVDIDTGRSANEYLKKSDVLQLFNKK